MKKIAHTTIKNFAIILVGILSMTSAWAQCSRETLQELADTYINAQIAGNAAMMPLAESAYYGENDNPMGIAEGMLSEAITPDFTRSFHTRMEANDDREVTIMESVVTDEDDWVFGADVFLTHTQQEDWGVIPEDQRERREVIRAAAEAYINNWGDPFLPVPHGTPCARLEGRIYTGNRDPEGQTCTMGAFPQPIKTGSRRFVIDTTIGAVSIFHNFSWLDAGLGPYHPGTPASQQFRVEGGMNRYIHEVTACTTPNCGRNFGPPPSSD
jgi:hypothetical protein